MSEEESYEELLDEAEDQYEDSQEMQEGQLDQYDSGAYSVAKEKSDIYNFFWKVARLMHPHRLARVGNLTKVEIGEPGISMRDAMNLANLGRIFHHDKFGMFWEQKARIIAETSMSKDGWFMETSISQKKVRQRTKPSTPFQKSRIFGRKRQENQQQQQQAQ